MIKSEVLGIVTGLLRTNDYETVAQSLSFLAVLAESASLLDAQSGKQTLVKAVISKKLLVLVLKTI